jgi:hypothetical protein
MKVVLILCCWLCLPSLCTAHVQYVYICTKDGFPIAYRDSPCHYSYQQKVISRYVKPISSIQKTKLGKDKLKTKKTKRNNSLDKVKKAAEQERRRKDRCDSVKERIAVIEDKYKAGYKANQKIKLDRSMQTLRRLHKKYCGSM